MYNFLYLLGFFVYSFIVFRFGSRIGYCRGMVKGSDVAIDEIQKMFHLKRKDDL